MTHAVTIVAPTAVYRFFDADGALLYVGITHNLGTRWKAHAQQKLWWGEVASHSLAWYPSRDEALSEEARAILAENPRYNIARPAAPTPEHAVVDQAWVAQVQADTLAELDAVLAERNVIERRAVDLNETERTTIAKAWRAGLPPSEIQLLTGRSSAHVRKLRPADVPPARTGGAAKRVQRQGAGSESIPVAGAPSAE